ncbi:hypothetical protein Micbo1qcDRAFT_165907, partial [Microdochium bolleyi]
MLSSRQLHSNATQIPSSRTETYSQLSRPSAIRVAESHNMAADKHSQQQSSPSHGGFTTGYSKNVQDRYAARTVANSGTYLLPYLDRLNSSNPGSSNNTPGRPAFTFLDVGCGPGSITVDFAQRYPQAFFVGVDPGITFVEAARARAADL